MKIMVKMVMKKMKQIATMIVMIKKIYVLQFIVTTFARIRVSKSEILLKD